MEPAIIVHGGAWNIPDRYTAASKEGVRAAASMAYTLLVDGGTALDAVQMAVMKMEDDPIFDAGIGCSLMYYLYLHLYALRIITSTTLAIILCWHATLSKRLELY